MHMFEYQCIYISVYIYICTYIELHTEVKKGSIAPKLTINRDPWLIQKRLAWTMCQGAPNWNPA